MRYGAFLRGINVGSSRRVKMEDLRGAFTSMGFGNVQTYIQSGNIFFDAVEKDQRRLEKQIQKSIHHLVHGEIPVMVRSVKRLREILERDPFRNHKASSEAKKFVSFLSREVKQKVLLPFFTPNKDVEIVAIEGADLFGLSHPYKGRSGYPGNFLETKFQSEMTTRFWETLQKMLAAQEEK